MRKNQRRRPNWYSNLIRAINQARKKYPLDIIVFHSQTGIIALRGRSLKKVVAQMRILHFDSMPVVSCPKDTTHSELTNMFTETHLCVDAKLRKTMSGRKIIRY